jgi:hypothetical protein
MDFVGQRDVAVINKKITVTKVGSETFINGDVVVDKDGREYVCVGVDEFGVDEWREFGYADANTNAIVDINAILGTRAEDDNSTVF